MRKATAWLGDRRLRVSFVLGMALLSFCVWAAGAFATVDPSLSSADSQVQSFFTANIGEVVGLYVGIAALLWLIGMAIHSVMGRRKRTI